MYYQKNKKATYRDFPGGPVVRSLPGDAGSIPGWGTRIPHAVGQLGLWDLEPVYHN